VALSPKTAMTLNTEQEAQLPQRNSASAADIEGRGLGSSPLPLRPLSLHLCVWSNPKATTYVLKRTVRKAHFKMNRVFKVILIGEGRNPEWSVVVMCH